MKHRILIPGDKIELGDEFLRNGKWIRFNDEDIKKTVKGLLILEGENVPVRREWNGLPPYQLYQSTYKGVNHE